MHEEHEFSFTSLFIPFTTFKAIQWIIVIGLAVYLNSLFNGFVGDDFAQLVNNPIAHSLGNIAQFFTSSTFSNAGSVSLNGIYYKPLLLTVFAAIYTLFGATSFPYHALQLLLHIGSSILLFFILKEIIKKPLAFIIALLFLVHPINNEAVVYISNMQDVLFLFFGLLALRVTQRKSHSAYVFVATSLLLLCSLLSKETGVLFLAIVPLYLYLFQGKWLTGLYQGGIVLSVYLFLRIGIGHIFVNQNTANVLFAHTSLGQKFINMPAIVLFYIKAFFFPYDLITNQRWIISHITFSSFFIPLLLDSIVVGLLFLFGFLVYKRQRNLLRIFTFFGVWFFIGMLLILQLLPLDFTVSDRWFYFPIIGLLGMLGVGFAALHITKRHMVVLAVCLYVIIAAFMLRDIVQNANWKSNLTFYKANYAYGADDYTYEVEYATELSNNGYQKEAMAHVLRSIHLHPMTLNWTILGLIDVRMHKVSDAKIALKQALSYDPTFYFANAIMGKLLTAYDNPHATIIFFKQFLAKYPKDVMGWLYLGYAEYKAGDRKEALQAVNTSLQIQQTQMGEYMQNDIQEDKKINATFTF